MTTFGTWVGCTRVKISTWGHGRVFGGVGERLNHAIDIWVVTTVMRISVLIGVVGSALDEMVVIVASHKIGSAWIFSILGKDR